MRRIWLVLLGALLLSATTAGAATYTVTDLGTLGGDGSKAFAINKLAQVVGESKNAQGVTQAFFWEKGKIVNVGALISSKYSFASGINDQGQVVGGANDANSNPRAFFWQKGASAKYLATLGGYISGAYDINNKGQIVGYSNLQTTVWDNRPCLWSSSVAKPTDLGTLKGPESSALGINYGGQVVGYSTTDLSFDFPPIACLWSGGIKQLAGEYSTANAINDSGQVVGYAKATSTTYQAFLWQSGTRKFLGALAGYPNSQAQAINNLSQVAGVAYKTGTTWVYRAFLWEKGVMKDLNTLIPAGSGWVLEYANGININGQIVGSGKHNGKPRAFLLTPGFKSRGDITPLLPLLF